MSTTKILVQMLTDYIRRNPKTSAMIAFNLGMYAATATKSMRKSDLAELPAKLVELVPSMKDITGYVPALAPPAKRPLKAKARPATRSRRAAKRPAARRSRHGTATNPAR
jgi:hypothetical protein